jgi:hypothetical protein
VHEITSASCSLSLWERAGVREYKWSSYFMRVPKIEIIYLKIYSGGILFSTIGIDS